LAAEEMMEFGEERIAKTAALFREVNERLDGINHAFALILHSGVFVCECADLHCIAPVYLSPSTYETLRQHPRRFLVFPDDDHVWPDVERVVERTEDYWVVEKFGEAGRIATERDPGRHRPS
jgi:hypothetical protein